MLDGFWGSDDMRYNGYEIVESFHMTMDGEPYEKIRNLKERFFTRPWKPLKKTKTIIPKIPLDKMYVMDNKIIMHPAYAEKIKKEISHAKTQTQTRP